jgi:predicted porin
LGNGTRNSGAGLEAGFGKVIMGVWDTPFKVAHNAIELFDNTTVFSSLNLLGRANGNSVNYNTRQKNQVIYWSPEMSGLQASAAYSASETNNALNILSGSLTYKADQLFLAVAAENRPVVFAGVTVVNDAATRLVAKYDAGQFWVGAMLENITVNKSSTVSYTQSNAELVGGVKMGTNSLALSYAKAGDTNVASTGASQVSLRYGFNFSKRTELFAAYTHLSNTAVDTTIAGSGGTYGFNAGTAFGSQAGSAQKAVGLGLIHSF